MTIEADARTKATGGGAQFREQGSRVVVFGQSRCDHTMPEDYAGNSRHMSIGLASRRSIWLSNGLR